jgi:hypothetical protein
VGTDPTNGSHTAGDTENLLLSCSVTALLENGWCRGESLAILASTVTAEVSAKARNINVLPISHSLQTNAVNPEIAVVHWPTLDGKLVNTAIATPTGYMRVYAFLRPRRYCKSQ